MYIEENSIENQSYFPFSYREGEYEYYVQC